MVQIFGDGTKFKVHCTDGNCLMFFFQLLLSIIDVHNVCRKIQNISDK